MTSSSSPSSPSLSSRSPRSLLPPSTSSSPTSSSLSSHLLATLYSSTVSSVYVSSLESTDKICMKVRAAIQREVTMTNKKVDLVWNKIQTLKETNDIMEEIICQTEDELW